MTNYSRPTQPTRYVSALAVLPLPRRSSATRAFHQAAWRRKAHVLRHSGNIERAVVELSAMLDTFYSELDGWLELADIYASCQQYTYALQALSHALLLSPQNPSYFLQYAETAYLAEDVPLALKTFLQAVDMTDDDDGDLAPSDSIPMGITLRAWFGVKLVRLALFLCAVCTVTRDLKRVPPVYAEAHCGTACCNSLCFANCCPEYYELVSVGRAFHRAATDRLPELKERVSSGGRRRSHICSSYPCQVDAALVLGSGGCIPGLLLCPNYVRSSFQQWTP